MVDDDEAMGNKMLCEDCKTPTLRIRQDRGQLVCTACGLCADSRIILLDMPDVKVFPDNPASAPNIRIGEKMRID